MGSAAVLIAGFVATVAARWCAAPPAVSVEEAQPRDLVSTVSTDCVVRAARVIRVTAGVAGVIEKVEVVEGQRVAVGDVLVRVGEARAKAVGRRRAAAVAEAQAVVERSRLDVSASRSRLALARKEAERRAALWRGHHLSWAEYRSAVSAAEIARVEVRDLLASASAAESLLRGAEAEERRDQVARRETVVRAPFAGLVPRVHVAEGLQVQGPQGRYRGSALLDLEGVGINVEADVLAREVVAIEAGQRAAVRVYAYPERAFEARVEEVGLDTVGVGVRVLMSPIGDWAGVRSGFGCEADVTASATEAVVAVPRRALLSRDGRLGVWQVDDGRVSFAPLSLGVRGDVAVEVLSGLAAGDLVVVGPHDFAGALVPGQRVRPVAAPRRRTWRRWSGGRRPGLTGGACWS